MTPRLPVFGRQGCRPWTDAEDAALAAEPSNIAAAEKLDRTVLACKRRRSELRKLGELGPVQDLPAPWTDAEDALLLSPLTMAELRRLTGRTKNAIDSRRRVLRKRGAR
jgi:hypothetical protein